ncbi:MAG: iron-sulfur cluster assembly scaffold protein [Candidatus Asgardarchaeum californiense]|nr:MAG: iron-sulfur cluster assembly scaffold protein [Candidatus Asgardarchaeum californiense]
MIDDFLNMVKELQKKIEYEEETTYSKIVIREYRNPTNFGILEQPDSIGELTGICNDTMKIMLIVKNGIIDDACFWTDGCGATIASGSMLMKMIKGMATEQAWHISKDDLLKELDGLPKEHLHCAKLAVDTLHSALKQLNK